MVLRKSPRCIALPLSISMIFHLADLKPVSHSSSSAKPTHPHPQLQLLATAIPLCICEFDSSKWTHTAFVSCGRLTLCVASGFVCAVAYQDFHPF